MNSGKIDFSPFIVDIGRLYGGGEERKKWIWLSFRKKRPFQHGIEKKEKNISLSIGCQQESKKRESLQLMFFTVVIVCGWGKSLKIYKTLCYYFRIIFDL